MRISDWSSDVCSSDLPLVVVPAEVEAAHAVICRAQPVQRIDRIGIEPQGLAKAVQRKRGIACGKLSLAPRRSEEHTSELQSLMRHSYAVFCLKKKITE